MQGFPVGGASQPSMAIGEPRQRTDGRVKVTGAARYAGDFGVPGMAHATLVQAPIARGSIQSMEVEDARSCPGVLAIYTGPDFGKAPDGQELPALRPAPEALTADFPAERRAPLSDNVVHYAGQHVALVVAETLLAAQHAAAEVRVVYQMAPAALTLAPDLPGAYRPEHFATNFQEDLNTTRGEPPAAPHVTIRGEFRTPVVHHNPIEPSASLAVWQGDELTLYDSTRWVQGSQKVLAHMLGVPTAKVRVCAPFVGGAFGSKGFLWQHVALLAQAARALGRPVKLVLTRPQMFTSTGHRPETIQQVSLSADAAGVLGGVEHETLSETSPVGHFVEPCGMTARNLYRTPYARIAHTVAPLNRATPCFMRAPGESSGMFALEVAMDELAERLGLDPVALRLHNDTEQDEQDERPFSSRHLHACLERGAALFGWDRRPARPRSVERGGKRVGWGMATAAYPARRSPAAVHAVLSADGDAVFTAATHELGGGTATVMEQVAADALGWPLDRVHFELGASAYPQAPVAGASQTVASVAPAVEAAAQQLRAALIGCAVADPRSPMFGLAPATVTVAAGRLHAGERVEDCRALLRRLPGGALARDSRAELGAGAKQNYTFHSFGAHFAEVTWDPDVAELRVTRWVSVLDCGRVLNPRTARSQIEGGVLFGLGMALLEATHYDPATGRAVNDNLAEYHLPTCADLPAFTVEFLEYPDLRFNPLGSRGIGEIGITGVPAALANAVYHATGARIRELPLTPDRIRAGESGCPG